VEFFASQAMNRVDSLRGGMGMVEILRAMISSSNILETSFCTLTDDRRKARVGRSRRIVRRSVLRRTRLVLGK
jgi:hypothetical protein